MLKKAKNSNTVTIFSAATMIKGPHALKPELAAKKLCKNSVVVCKKTERAGRKGGNYSRWFCATSTSCNRAVYFGA
jgi:hypothetical protein